MNRRSIRFRLAVWYSVVLALALVTFGGVSWIAGPPCPLPHGR